MAWPLKRGLIVLLAVTAVLLTMSGLPRVLVTRHAVVKIDLWVSDSSYINVYVNDEAKPPARQTLMARERRMYIFPVPAEDIRLLRIDPGKIPSERVDLCEVSIEDDGGLVRRFEASQLAAWGALNVESVEIKDGCLRFRAANDSPILYTNERIVLHRRATPILSDLVRAINEPSSVGGVVTVGFLLLLLVGRLDPVRRWHLSLAILTVGGTILLVRWIVPLPHALPPVDQAVGRLALFGFSRQGNSLAVMASVAWAIFLAAVVSLVDHRRRTAPAPESGSPTLRAERPFARRRWALTAGAGFIVLSQLPDVAAQLRDMAGREFFPHWDLNNVITWAYLSHNGYLPFRDFWYPYGGQYTFDWPAPWGLLNLVSYRVLLFAVFSLALYTASAGALLPTLLALLAILQGEASVFPATIRYLLSATVALAYIAIDRGALRATSAHLLFWSGCALALFLEPLQLAYAAPFIAFTFLLDAREQWPRWRELGRSALLAFGVPAVLLLVALGWAAAHGQMPGLLDFYGSFVDQANFGAIPTDIVAATRRPFSTPFLILVAPPLLISLGLYERLRSPAGAHRPAEILLGLGWIGVMIFQKHIVRPIDAQAFYVPFLGLLVYGMVMGARRRRAEYLVLGVIAGAYVGVMAHSSQLAVWARDVADTPRRLAEAPRALGRSDLIHEANAQRFAPERFRRFTDEVDVVARVRTSQPGRTSRVFVLSDDPVIYVLLGQPPPYHTNVYSNSPIYEQRRVAEWMRINQPDLVVWDPRNTLTDGVQAWVRAPLIYETVIDGYVLKERVGRFDILRRRASGEAISLSYWRDRLGPEVTLGHIPRLSGVSSLQRCPDDGGDRCRSFLQIEVRGSLPQETPFTMTFKGAGVEVRVRLALVPGERAYYISLDRLWFFTALAQLGSAPTVTFDQSPSNVTVMMIRRARQPETLY